MHVDTALAKIHGCWYLFNDDKISTLDNGQVKATLEVCTCINDKSDSVNTSLVFDSLRMSWLL